MNTRSLTHYATRDGIPPRKAQRYNAIHRFGEYDSTIGNGIWFLTENDWQTLKTVIPESKKDGQDEDE